MRIKRFRDMIRIRTVPPPLSKKYLENLLRECKNRGEFLKKIEKSQGVKIELVDKPPSSYNKIRNRIRLYRGALRANKQSFLAELCHELGHAKARKYFVGDIFMLLIFGIFGITMWRFWLPYDVVATFPFLFLLSLLAVIMYLVGAIRLVKSTAEIKAHIFAAKTLGRLGVQACVHGNPTFFHPGCVGYWKASERRGQNPESAILVEETTRENERKCKSLRRRFKSLNLPKFRS